MRYRKINNKGSVLRSPWASVFISSEKSKPCDFTFIYPRRTYFCDCLHAKSLYLKYPWLQSEPLPPKSHRKDKFRNLSTGMRTTKCSLKTLKPLILLGFQTFFDLFQLAPCKLNLNTFVYEIYQRVFIFNLNYTVKHSLSNFLLPFRCHKNYLDSISSKSIFPIINLLLSIILSIDLIICSVISI